MFDYGLILIKLAAGFIGLWMMTRFLGKKEISQLTPFDFISSVILSELVGNTIYDKNVHFPMLLFSLAVWTVLSYLFEKITQHAAKLRKPMEGEAVVLIRNGEIDIKKMRDNSLDFEQLRMMLRQKDIFSLRDVDFAIYETNGSLSILKKPQYQSVQRKDMKLPPTAANLTCSLVEDGEVQRDSLARTGKDEEWLRHQLQANGFPDIRTIAFAEISEDGKLSVIPRIKDL